MEPETIETTTETATEVIAETVADTAPLLERPRLTREPLVPAWVPITLGSLAALAVIITLVVVFLGRGGSIVVPKVVGIDVGVARTRLAQQGLKLTITEKRFSSLPADTVMEQTPAPGLELKHGEAVTVVVSAGSEDFPMPDLVGTGLAYARGQLEGKGLEVRVQSEPSDQASDTVLASNPAAGSSMRTGDIVTLTIATAGVGNSILLPTSMQGVVVTLDPAPVAAGKPDVTLDVARRVRSLLEASGATVMTTRALADTGTAVTEDERAKRAKSSASHVALGLEATTLGKGSLVALSPVSGSVAVPSAKLASEIASSLASSGLVATSTTTPTDKVLGATGVPFSRVRLGSFSVREDAAAFADPNWADRVARAIYRALAETYGRKEPTP
jgi:N-acetylmuramoyl-L-alanine amidase